MDMRVLVACHDASGVPVLVPVTVRCTQDQYDEGEHYVAAREAVTEEDYDGPYVGLDENDSLPEEVFDALFTRYGGSLGIDITEG